MQQHSWLYSDSFLKRAFAIWGHYMVANLIIGGCLLVLFFFMALAFGLNLADDARRDADWMMDDNRMGGDAMMQGNVDVDVGL